jgi:hypothetical protein
MSQASEQKIDLEFFVNKYKIDPNEEFDTLGDCQEGTAIVKMKFSDIMANIITALTTISNGPNGYTLSSKFTNTSGHECTIGFLIGTTGALYCTNHNTGFALDFCHAQDTGFYQVMMAKQFNWKDLKNQTFKTIAYVESVLNKKIN